VTFVLGSGGLSALAANRARLVELRRRGLWPAQVPTVVLTEALTGDHRRDVATNRLLHTCQLRAVDEISAREASRLRTATRRAGTILVVDTVVAAMASDRPGGVVLTSDPRDLWALAQHAARPIAVVEA